MRTDVVAEPVVEKGRNLGVIEAVGLSIATVAPTLVMAFNFSLAVAVVGRAAPLVFAVGTAVVLVVGLSFVAWSRRMAHVGSAYAYIAQAFGGGAGFVAGWSLLLTYLTYGAGTAAMVGNFVDAALHTAGWQGPHLWVLTGVLSIALAALLACRDAKLAGRLMLAMEGLSVLAVLVLTVVILLKVKERGGLTAAPFIPQTSHGGWAGVGYALVFAVFSFGGFEAAATLGEETADAQRNIPLAIVLTLLIAGGLYVFVSYGQVLGYGLTQMDAFAKDPAPLDTLAAKFMSRGFALALDVAAAVGSFSCVLGSLAAGGRMLYALTRGGLSRRAARRFEGDAGRAAGIVAASAIALACLLLCARLAEPGTYYGALGTVGTLALMLVYMCVAAAQAREAGVHGRVVGTAVGVAGVLVLVWPLYNGVYPLPAYPGNLWPMLTVVWIVLGVVLVMVRPALRKRSLPDAE